MEHKTGFSFNYDRLVDSAKKYFPNDTYEEGIEKVMALFKYMYPQVLIINPKSNN